MKFVAPQLVLGLTSCGTILTFSSPDTKDAPFQPRPFGGVRLDALAVYKTAQLEGPLGTLMMVVLALDLPFSTIADLVTLPITAILASIRCSSPAGSADGGVKKEGGPIDRTSLRTYRHDSHTH